ncbi:MAG: NAD-dependent epimerase/dehydratase family protein [Pseudomonadota bacterium]
MKVFILGPTGEIGEAVTKELVAAGHDLTGLCRSDASAARLENWGGRPVRGDIREPEAWASQTAENDAIINLADTFDDDMPDLDARMIDALEAAATQWPRFLYTGGCWLYGATGDHVAVETDPMDGIPAYRWAAKQGKRLLASDAFSSAIIHPAMVYHEGGGVFGGFLNAASRGVAPVVTGGPKVRWPLVHRDDLAVAYRLLLERPDLIGHFNVTAEEGVPVGEIAHHLTGRSPAVRTAKQAMEELGGWAEGLALDQQISSEKLRSQTDWRPRFEDYRQIRFRTGS